MNKLAILACLMLCTAAVASIVVTETPGKHVLQPPNGAATQDFDTHEACAAAAQAHFAASAQPSEESTCSAQTKVLVTGVCDTPRPDYPNAERELRPIQDEKDDTKWWNWERAWVPADYPTCWVKGWEIEKHPMDGPAPDPGEFWTPPVTPEMP